MKKIQKPVQNGERERSSDEVKLPASKKIYIESNRLRVPFREIALTQSKTMDGTLEENPPVRVYDTSGPWTDPDHPEFSAVPRAAFRQLAGGMAGCQSGR